MASVLIIDDDKLICDWIAKAVTQLGHRPVSTHLLREGLSKIQSEPFDIVFLDVQMPDGSGLEIMPKLKAVRSSPEIIAITGLGDPDEAEIAIQNGAWDYIEKPASFETLKLPIIRALEYRAERKSGKPPAVLQRKDIIGDSQKITACLELLVQAADSSVNVLITGETGTGKELFAKAIHFNSPRSKKNFVVVDCTALPETLVESVLFGHERGAFTGAERSQEGLIKQADGGTLFLDEVSTISQDIQVKLLRVIQEREFRRLGDLENIQVDVRIIAATNTDLQAAVRQGTFRDDLYYRLNVIVIKIPPLRERAEDIPLLSKHFVRKYGEENQRDSLSLDPSALKILMEYPWPGNVRELENVIERAVVLSQGNDITPDLFPKNVMMPYLELPDRFAQDNTSLKERVSNFEKAIILAALEKTDWNQKKAAQILSVNATTLSEKLKRFKIRERLSGEKP